MKLGDMKIITLKAGEYEADFAPEVGGMLIRLTKNGVDSVNVPKEEARLRKDPTPYGLPLLFPPNRIDGGHFTFRGREFQFELNEAARGNSLHGFLHTRPFEVKEQSETRLVMSYTADETSDFFRFYPVYFTVERAFELSEDGLCEKVTVINNGREALPFGLGFHTAFAVDPDTKIRVSIGKRIEVNERMLPTGVVRDLNEGERAFREEGQSPVAWDMDDHYTVQTIETDGKPFHGAILERKDAVITYTVDPFYRHWMIWNKGCSGDMICIEPQDWRINAPNLAESLGAEAGFDYLEPGESVAASSCISIALR